METKNILPIMINGVVMGFTIGVGFILANKLFNKPSANNETNFSGTHNTTRSSYRQFDGDTKTHEIDELLRKPSQMMPKHESKLANFDFTLGSY
jgi:hypothetical protein